MTGPPLVCSTLEIVRRSQPVSLAPRSVTFSILALVAGVMFSCVQSASFVYMKVFGRGVEILEAGDPPIGYFWHGDPVPILYRVVRDDAVLTIGIGRESFIPSLRIQSESPILAVRTKDCGFVFHRNDLEYGVSWGHWRGADEISCVKLGETVEIEIEVEGAGETILVYGTIKESGVFYFTDSL